VEKDVKSNVAANCCDGRLVANFIMIIQVQNRNQHRFIQIVVIIFFVAISLPSQPFLGRHLGFHIFFSQRPSSGLHTFFTTGLFLDYINLMCVTVLC